MNLKESNPTANMDPRGASSQPNVPTRMKSPGDVTGEVTEEDQRTSLGLKEVLAGIDDAQSRAWLDPNGGLGSSAHKTVNTPLSLSFGRETPA